jgi:hypothetical protein
VITDLAVLGVGAFLILVALIWKAYRLIDERLNEIQADIGELQNGVARLFLLVSKSEATTSNPEPLVAPGGADVAAHKSDGLALLQSPGLESDLAQVDELCAKLITLVPPAEAAPLIAAVPQVKPAPLISEVRAERPTQFEGRKRILAWPRGARRSQR